VSLLVSGCGTLSTARPLDPGEHMVGATFGGPIIDAGFAVTPLPSLVVGGRSGVMWLLNRPLEVDYGLNLTAAAFGIFGSHVGSSWLAAEQLGARPALAITERLYFYDNHLNFSRDADMRASYLLNQVELTGSWDSRWVLAYVAAGAYLDFVEPVPMLTPAVGASIHLGPRWDLQLEGRYYAVNLTNDYTGLQWVTLGPGALGGTVSASRRMGDKR
jgi:hypothetical protein